VNRGDGPATIAWLRQQDWFPGALATWGASYLGYAQWDLAGAAIAEWKAAIIDVAPADFYHHFMYQENFSRPPPPHGNRTPCRRRFR
jgi:uncharacterized protein